MKYALITLFLVLTAKAQHYSSSDNEKLKLSPQTAGNILLGEMNCVSCHESVTNNISTKQAPALDNLSSRLKQNYIIEYLKNPQKVKPGTSMPDVLHALPEDKKEESAIALGVYLTKDWAKTPDQESSVSSTKKGKELFHSIGCVACHSPRDKDGKELSKDSIPLGDLANKYHRTGLTEFLFQPHKVRPSGRMPDMKLSKEEAKEIATYLSQDPDDSNYIKIENDLLLKGKKLFDELNCRSCHKLEGHKPLKSKSLADLTGIDCKGPKYSLSEKQKTNIKAALSSKKELTKAEKIHKTLSEFNCYSCHERDSIGGPGLRSQFFTSTEGELAAAGRFPPPLTNIGAKLQRSWMHKVLFQGESLRHYMVTRMPQFGEHNIGHLVDLFDSVDKVPKSGITPVVKREEKKAYREAGWKLVGTEGNSCIACHNYNSHPSLGLKALDIVSTSKRLKPDWFYHYMINPTAYRPGVVMPSFWPGGHSTQKGILKGDTTEQLRAMWHYFTIGQTQRLPRGLKVPPVELQAKDQVKVYRGRSTVAGFRGIAIGFPEGLNMAFDAEFMNYTTFWKGKFVQVNWRGQAPGNFSPAERATAINSGIPFATLKANEQWPVRAKIEGKERLNPDPLFVKRHAYKFKGYYTEKDFAVLMYIYRGISIEDKLEASIESTLKRTIEFNSNSPQSFSFKIVDSDKIKKVSEKKFTLNDSLEIQTEKEAGLDNNKLIMDLQIPKGKSKIIIEYRSLK